MPHRFVYTTATERFPLRRDNPSSVAQVEDFNTGVPNDGGSMKRSPQILRICHTERQQGESSGDVAGLNAELSKLLQL